MSIDDLQATLRLSRPRKLALGAAIALLAGIVATFAEAGVYFWIGVGSALGGIARYWFSGLAARLWGETFPWGTLLINVIGSFVIGFFGALTYPDGRIFVGSTARLFVMVGICGGYTTFSSFSLQTLKLLNDGEWLSALVAVWAGQALAVGLNSLRFL